MNTVTITRTLVVALVLVLTATGLWAAAAEEEPAAAMEKEMVTDPTTGKMVTAPEYGGTITYVKKESPSHTDKHLSGGVVAAGLVVEKLGIGDWATPRDEYNFPTMAAPKYTRGALAESWEMPDDNTVIVKVRQGVHWHDKAPMNGRELTADDIVYNFHRTLGLGSGFTEPSAAYSLLTRVSFESITATDQWTVVFKLKEPNLLTLMVILDDSLAVMYPPEVIKEHGDVTDWRNLVGTGPFELTDWTEGSSITFIKNPGYWGYDEKYPENRLPYADTLRALIMPEVATQLAAMRTGKVDYVGVAGVAQLRTVEQVESIQRTNPEVELWPVRFRSDNGFAMNTQIEPFDDIRVRKAMNMAPDFETINNSYFKGFGDPIPQGRLGRFMTDGSIPFEDWPEELRKGRTYNPEAAEALLDAAGYPRGADGTRFKTVLMHLERFDLNYAELVASYWDKIGVDVEIEVTPGAAWGPRRKAQEYEMASNDTAYAVSMQWAVSIMSGFTTDGVNSSVSDPTYDAMHAAAAAATTVEERDSLMPDLVMYALEQYWTIYGPLLPQFSVNQPWLIGYNGEMILSGGEEVIFSRLWIDSALKKEMGF